MPQTLKKNDILPLTNTAITQDGNGLGRTEAGMVVFVPMTAAGDIIRARIVKILSSHAFGVVEEMLTPSPRREENTCPAYKRCGGCGLRHLSYAEELAVKAGWVEENLRRIGHLSIPLEPPIPAPQSERYRNKAQYPIRRVGGKICAGFYARRSHELVPVEDCPLQPACFAAIAKSFCDFLEERGLEPYDETTGKGLVRTLYLRLAETTGQVMVCIIANGGGIPGEMELVERLRQANPDIATVVLNINRRRDNVILGDGERILYGDGRIEDKLGGVTVRLSARSFYQVNRAAAELLYQKALEFAAPHPEDTLLDLYCGAGTIGLAMAGRVRQVVGVEVVEAAVEDARHNAAANGISNASFFCADATAAVELLRERRISPRIAVLDPPRKGVDPAVLAAIPAMGVERVVYVSCNSATLARDCARLAALGYEAQRAVAVDLFPRTAHVEAVVSLKLGTGLR
jgi:23S rRNA (uracil1939-C5)-methyltransferase